MGIIRASTYEPFTKARLDNVQLTDAGTSIRSVMRPQAITDGGAVVWAAQGEELHRSDDDGDTWTLIYDVNEYIAGAWQLPNGEMAVSTKVGGGIGGLWVSEGIQNGNATWEKTLSVSQNDNKIHEAWGLSTAPAGHRRAGLVVTCEYGGHGNASTPPDGGARAAWLSLDYGRTWTEIFDLFQFTGTVNSQHMHAAAYDPYDDRIILTFGDGNSGENAQTATVASDNYLDVEPAWSYLVGPHTNATYQATTILPLPGCVLLGGDGMPPGIYRLPRRGYRDLGPIQTVLNYGGSTSTGFIGRHMYQVRPGAPVLISNEWAKDDEQPPSLHMTIDGTQFFEVWRDTNTQPRPGVDVIGPTRTGRVFLYFEYDTRFQPSGMTTGTADLVIDATKASR